MADYLAVVAWAQSRWGHDAAIFIHGHSIGASLAIQVLARLDRPPAGLILECAFDSASSMLKAIYGGISISLSSSSIGSTVKALGTAPARDQTPLLTLISETDELVPRSLNESVHGALGQPIVSSIARTFVIVSGAFHDTAFRRRGWSEAIVSFLKRSLARRSDTIYEDAARSRSA